MRWLLVLAVVLTGCSSDVPDAQARANRKAQRLQAAEVKLQTTPKPRTYRYADGELQVIEVPVQDSSGFLDIQRCFVWRDEALKTASISCGQMPDVLLTN